MVVVTGRRDLAAGSAAALPGAFRGPSYAYTLDVADSRRIKVLGPYQGRAWAPSCLGE